MGNEAFEISDSEDDDEQTQASQYAPTGDAYMAGLRSNIAEQIWTTRSTVHNSQLTCHGSQFTAHNSQLPAPASAVYSYSSPLHYQYGL
ncbi:unnamed protein product [Cochlearia groenlandica]